QLELLLLGVSEEVVRKAGVAAEDDQCVRGIESRETPFEYRVAVRRTLGLTCVARGERSANTRDDRRGDSVLQHAREKRFVHPRGRCAMAVAFRSAEVRHDIDIMFHD